MAASVTATAQDTMPASGDRQQSDLIVLARLQSTHTLLQQLGVSAHSCEPRLSDIIVVLVLSHIQVVVVLTHVILVVVLHPALQRVQKHLWSRKPPAPLTAEEQAAEDAWKLAVKQENKAKRVAKATAKAQSGGAGAGPSTSAAGSAGHGQARVAQDGAKVKGKRKAGATAAAGVGDEEAGGTAVEDAGQGEEDEQQPSKKGKRTPKVKSGRSLGHV